MRWAEQADGHVEGMAGMWSRAPAAADGADAAGGPEPIEAHPAGGLGDGATEVPRIGIQQREFDRGPGGRHG